METTAEEVREALNKRKLVGPKELTDLEDKIFGKVMFETQFRRAAGKKDNIETYRSSISEYSDQPALPMYKPR